MKKYNSLYSTKRKLLSSYFAMSGIIIEIDNKKYMVNNLLNQSEFQYLSDLHKIQRVLLYISNYEFSNYLHYEQEKRENY